MRKSLALLFLLSGCVTPQQRLEQARAEAAQIDYNKKVYCTQMGAPEGSKNYYDCRKTIEQIETARQMQQMEIARQNSAYMSAAGNSAMMGVSDDAYYQPGYSPQGTRCTTHPDVFGKTLITDCGPR
jgi:N-acetylmuramic acid 6-phosphate (MurNAc-6-P) etherase